VHCRMTTEEDDASDLEQEVYRLFELCRAGKAGVADAELFAQYAARLAGVESKPQRRRCSARFYAYQTHGFLGALLVLAAACCHAKREAGGYQFPYMIAVVSRLACTGLYWSPTAALMGPP
jgi:hypothetical protein